MLRIIPVTKKQLPRSRQENEVNFQVNTTQSKLLEFAFRISPYFRWNGAFFFFFSCSDLINIPFLQIVTKFEATFSTDVCKLD